MGMFKLFGSFSQEGAGGGRVAESEPEEPRMASDEQISRQVAEFMSQREKSSDTYRQMLKELDDFAEGRGDELIKLGTYPGWARTDFKALRAAVNAAEREAEGMGNRAA